MSCTDKTGLCSGSDSGYDLMKTFLIIQSGSIENLPDHAEKNICFGVHDFSTNPEKCLVCICRICLIKNFYSARYTTGFCVDLIGKFTVAVMLCIHKSQNRFQKSKIWNHGFIQIFQIKHYIQITNSIGRYFMIKEKSVSYLQFCIAERCYFGTDIFSFQHRDTFGSFRIFRCLLICFQGSGLICQCLFFFF